MRERRLPLSLLAIAAAALVAACGGLARLDPTSLKQLTDLKGETKIVLLDCSKGGAHGAQAGENLRALDVRAAQALEYEVGKAGNAQTVEQLRILSGNINETRERFLSNKWAPADGSCTARGPADATAGSNAANAADGCLNAGYCGAKWRALESAFDIAISTEGLKNK